MLPERLLPAPKEHSIPLRGPLTLLILELSCGQPLPGSGQMQLAGLQFQGEWHVRRLLHGMEHSVRVGGLVGRATDLACRLGAEEP